MRRSKHYSLLIFKMHFWCPTVKMSAGEHLATDMPSLPTDSSTCLLLGGERGEQRGAKGAERTVHEGASNPDGLQSRMPTAPPDTSILSLNNAW